MSRSVCWLCYKVASPTLKGVVRHMAAVHAHDPHFHICCGVGGCSRTYSNFYSFKKHLYRRHRDHLDMTGPFTTSSTPSDPSSLDFSDTEEDGLEDLDYDNLESMTASKFEDKKQMALLLLKIKEVRKVSQSALDGIIEDISLILQQTIGRLKASVNSCLQSHGMSVSVFDGLSNVFNDPSILNPFDQLESKFLQEKFYREHLDLLVCVMIMLFN